MTKRHRTIIFHILGSIGFMLMPVLFSPDFNTGRNLFSITPFQNVFCRQLLLLLFFYINYYVLLPQLFFKERRIIYFLVSLIAFYLILKIPDWILPLKAHTGAPPVRGVTHDPERRRAFKLAGLLFSGGIFQFLIIYLSSMLMKINVRMDIIRQEKVQAELSYLKAQINPHFLFNTLNSLYALTLEKSDEAPEAVLKLSGIMRYIVGESARDWVPLTKEIQYVHDYIDLQQLRMDDRVSLSFELNGVAEGKQIAPMLLIPFIENAFKYGIGAEAYSEISILIQISEYEVQIRIVNTLADTVLDPGQQTGTGIRNVVQRLDMLYPGRYKLQHGVQQNGTYLVDLKIFVA